MSDSSTPAPPAGEPVDQSAQQRGNAADQWLVGIGSSAGGIEALRELLPGLVGGDVTYIIAQHMSPARPSLLVQVLARETSLDVREVEDGERVRPGVVYLVPPNCDVEVVSGRFVQREAEPRISPQPSIDVLLRSLAHESASRSVAVILSGTGSDGAEGSTTVRAAGGRAVAQNPDSARYRDMPLAAIDSGDVEFVVEPRDVGPLIGQIISGQEPGSGKGQRTVDPVMAALARHARQVTGWDLSAYKEGTLGRQLGRRISALGLTSVDEYVDHVADQPEELVRLRDAMLISVTSFLRDQNSFEVLSASLRELVESSGEGHTIRAWVAGCATGEEAYTLAILLVEACRAADVERPIKVFATDISETAMETARRGVYPLTSLADLPSEWVERYFRVEGTTAVVNKWLRNMLVIARHDVTRDPPMVRMDLVSCRNLLIYLQPSVQEKVLRNLQAALNNEGLLFLGRSESIAEGKELFSTISGSNRVYRRRPGPALPILSAPLSYLESPRPRPPRRSARTSRDRVRDGARDRLLLDYGPPALVLDHEGTPVHKIGDVERYLTLPSGDDDFSIDSMIDPALRTELKTLLARSQREGVADASHPVVLHRDQGASERLVLRARTLASGGTGTGMTLLVFESRPVAAAEPEIRERMAARAQPSSSAPEDEASVAILEAQLAASQEHLQAVVEELESSNEELQAMNEELQSSTEELQAMNEELQASGEELQATNEELTTVNETLEVRTTELSESNEVLRSIQESVHTAVVLLDRMQRVTQYSPLAVKVFGLVPDDIGSPLARHNSHLDVTDLEALVDDVMDSGEGQVLETRAGSVWYILQVLPFQMAGRTVGAILALSDITDLGTARQDADEQRLLAEGIFAHGGTPMAWLTATGEIETVNTPFAELIGVPPSNLIGRRLSSLVAPAHVDGLVEQLAELSDRTQGRREMSLEMVAATDESISVDLTVAVIEAPQSGVRRMLATAHDTSAALHAQEVIAGQGRDLEAVFWGPGVPMALLDGNGQIRRANRSLATLLDRPVADIVGRALQDFVHPEDRDAGVGLFLDLGRGQLDEYETEQRFVTREGGIVRVRVLMNSTPRSRGEEVDAVIATLVDVTEDRDREHAALRQAQSDPLTGLVNRTVVFDRISEAAKLTARSDESLSILFIDLDGFKAINDQFGHDGGDLVLQVVARRISEVARDVDTAARLGGDEFLVLARHQGSEPADKGYRLAERIQAAISQPIPAAPELLGQPHTVTASIGVAHCPTDGADADDLVRKADVAMYAAKASGGAEIAIYSDRFRDERRRAAILRSEIVQALQNGGFVPYYQPIVSVADGGVASFEALARWQHPERGVITPGEFLTDVKAFHQLDDFTIVMAEQAAGALAAFRDVDPRVMVSLNLDPSQLASASFQQRLLAAVGGDLSGWLLELSESDPMGGDPALVDALRGLRDLGAQISLDDFGTGYSNFAHLRSWGFDEVKIDRSLIEAAGNEEDDTVLTMMIELAHAMGSACVAEGVESPEQIDLLRGLGADRVQGFAVLPPVDLDTARNWLASPVGSAPEEPA